MLNAIDTLFYDYKLVIMDIHHGDNSLYANGAFADPGKKTIAGKVIQSIYIQLARNQLMKEFLAVGVLKYLKGGGQPSSKFLVQLPHEQVGKTFMLHFAKQRILKCVRKRPVADVVQ